MLRRLAGEVVPLAAGVLVASVGLAFLDPAFGLAAGLLAWCLASWALARLRRRPVLRRVYRLVLLAHVLIWGAQGVLASVPEPPGPPAVASRTAWGRAQRFRAGFGEARFALPEEATLAGWGGRPRRQRWPAFLGMGVVGRASLALQGAPVEGAPPRLPLFRGPEGPGDALGARALVLVPEEEGPAVAFVRLDLITLEPSLAEAVRREVRAVRLTPATLLLSATHTHTGPGGFHRAPAAAAIGTDHFDRRTYDAVLRAAVTAIESAARAARPARLAPFSARDRRPDGSRILAQNRAGDLDRIDDRVLGLRVEGDEDGQVLGVLLNYAVQPVILRRFHMAFGRDLVGAVEDALAAALPGEPPVVFVNGPMGDISPCGTYGQGPAAARRLAADFAAAVRDDVLRAPAHPRLRVRAALALRDLGSPHLVLSTGPRPAFDERVVPSAWGEDAPAVLANLISLPANLFVWGLGLSEIRVGFTFDGAAGLVAVLDRSAGERRRRFGALVLDLEGDADAGVRATHACLLWQGGIPTEAVGRRWRALAAARDLPTPLLLALTNDGTGYFTTAMEYDEERYEARASLYGREGAARAAEALDAALTAALDSAP